MRRPVYLGLLPAPREGVHDITALYLARFRAPGPNQQLFIRSCQHRHGWQSFHQDHRALVPPQPAPLPPPAPNDPVSREAREGSEGEFSLLGLRLLRALALKPSAPCNPCNSFNPFNPFNPFACTSSLLPLGTPRPHTPCTRGTRFLACHRRQSHCRELWRGT